ncbi:hypothetical protein HKX48_005013 [Thoreauomyces humboldtii]|nr:hypothetical protein HKX48_005013 [Thoreauomyces humboldtii]
MLASAFAEFPVGLYAMCAQWLGPDCFSASSRESFLSANATSPPHYAQDAASQPLPSLSSLASCAYLSLPTLEASELCMIILPVACYWVYSTFLFVLSLARITSVELHRIPTDQKMRPANRITVAHVLKKVAVQHVVQIIVAYVLAVGTRPDDMGERPVEAPLLFIAKVVAACVMLDTYQYWMHRWMHNNRWLYRHFHSVHHELTVLYAYGALYNHPLEGLLMDTIGSGLPTLILDMHPWTSTFFFSLATLKTVDDHCGYALPWDPLQRFFRNNAVYHDIHHWGKGRMYNFSQPFFTFWDVWMGTDYEIEMKRKAVAKAEATSAMIGSGPRAAVTAVPASGAIAAAAGPITPTRPTRKEAGSTSAINAHISSPGLEHRTRDSAQTVVGESPSTPPSPSLSSSGWSSDSALGSSCGDWDACSHSSGGEPDHVDDAKSVISKHAVLAEHKFAAMRI